MMKTEQSTGGVSAGLRDLFHRPERREIAGVPCYVYQFAFEQFPEAIALGDWWSASASPLDALRELSASGSLQWSSFTMLLAGSIKVAVDADTPADGLPFMTPAELAQLPVVAIAQMLLAILEVNADFFTAALPGITAAAQRLMSTGGALRSSLSAPATSASTSPATPLPS